MLPCSHSEPVFARAGADPESCAKLAAFVAPDFSEIGSATSFPGPYSFRESSRGEALLELHDLGASAFAARRRSEPHAPIAGSLEPRSFCARGARRPGGCTSESWLPVFTRVRVLETIEECVSGSPSATLLNLVDGAGVQRELDLARRLDARREG